MPERCCGEVQSSTTFWTNQCLRNGTIIIGGKSYCWQHDPEKVAARAARKDEELEKELKDLYRKNLSAVICKNVSTEELEEINQQGGLRALLDERCYSD